MGIIEANHAYEAWLARQLGGAVVRKDLRQKHDGMVEGPLPFLRATYYLWAQEILNICPELAEAPPVVAVGDIHLENFGTWRDADGRLVWGVNDFDEAAEMPYALDLVRLATSALVADTDASGDETSAAILKGYRQGLGSPLPIILERDRAWLRELVGVPEKDRAKFWKKL